MHRVCVRGVVKDGQVVLEVPLNLPDGTFVTVTDHDPIDIEPVGRDTSESRETAIQLLLALKKRAELRAGTEGQAKVGVICTRIEE